MVDFNKEIHRENTGCVKYDFREKYFGTADVIPMWVADMDIETPEFITHAMRERIDHPIFGYTLKTDEFYDSIVQWNNRRNQWNLDPQWISFSPGIVPAVNLLVMTFTEPGDKVLVQTPVYYPFFSAVKNHKRELVCNPLKFDGNKYHMDYELLEEQLKAGVKMAILCSPHNPVGRVWEKEELERFAMLCLKYNTLIVSDEIHSDLIFPGNKHIPLASLSDEFAQNTITCMAPSKTFNTAGLSSSFLITPNKKLKLRYERTLDHVHVGAGNIFGDIALIAAYRHGDAWVDELMRYFDATIRTMQTYIEETGMEIGLVKPEGTYLVWLDFRKWGLKPQALKKLILEDAKVGMSDGPIFGPEGEGFQRMNIGCPLSTVEEALKRVEVTFNKIKISKFKD